MIVNVIVIIMLHTIRAAKKDTNKNEKEDKAKAADYDYGE